MTAKRKKDIKTFPYPELITSKFMSSGKAIPFWYSNAQGETGPWVVLIHGLGVDCSVWDPYLKDLLPKHNVLLVDLPGHGSNPTPFSLEESAKQIRFAMQQIRASSAVMIGHCIGGCVAQVFSTMYPERCEELILIDTFPLGGEQYQYASFKWLSAVKPLMLAVPSPVFSGALTGLFSARKDGRRALYPQIREQKVLPVYKVFQSAMQAMSKYPTPTYLTEDYRRIPVHYLVGSRDPLYPIKRWNQEAAELHKGTFQLLDKCGHYSITDNPDLVWTEIRSLLS